MVEPAHLDLNSRLNVNALIFLNLFQILTDVIVFKRHTYRQQDAYGNLPTQSLKESCVHVSTRMSVYAMSVYVSKKDHNPSTGEENSFPKRKPPCRFC